MTNNTLKRYAHTLRLSGLLSTLELRLKEAEASRLPYHQFLEIVFQDELNVREQTSFIWRGFLFWLLNCQWSKSATPQIVAAIFWISALLWWAFATRSLGSPDF